MKNLDLFVCFSFNNKMLNFLYLKCHKTTNTKNLKNLSLQVRNNLKLKKEKFTNKS